MTRKVAAKPRQVSRSSHANVTKYQETNVAAELESAGLPENAAPEPLKPGAILSLPVNAEQISLPPLAAPLPVPQSGVVGLSEPEVLFVTPTTATRAVTPPKAPAAVPSKSATNTSATSKSASSKPGQFKNRPRGFAPHGAYQGPANSGIPLSEITPSKDPAPAPEFADRNPIRGN